MALCVDVESEVDVRELIRPFCVAPLSQDTVPALVAGVKQDHDRQACLHPVIQGYSVEDLLADVDLKLPLYGLTRQGALFTA